MVLWNPDQIKIAQQRTRPRAYFTVGRLSGLFCALDFQVSVPLAVADRFCENACYEKLSLAIPLAWVGTHRLRVLGGDFAQHGFLASGVPLLLFGRRGAYYRGAETLFFQQGKRMKIL